MIPQSMQIAGGQTLESAASLNWFDASALAVVAVFLIMGWWKGFAWQVGRLAILVGAYLVPLLFGRGLGSMIAGAFPADSDPELPYHIASATLFIVTLTAVSIAAWVFRKVVEHSPLSLGNRVAGSLAGTAFGALLVVAVMTLTLMFSSGGNFAIAAEHSTSADVSRGALRMSESVLPEMLAERARQWRGVLGDPTVQPASIGTPPATTDGK